MSEFIPERLTDQCGEQPGPTVDTTAALAIIREVKDLGNGVGRSMEGEWVLGFRVAAYRETHPEHGNKFGHRYCEHWSTPSQNPAVKVDRLFTEDQLRQSLDRLKEAEEYTAVANLDLAKVYDENQALIVRANTAEEELGLIRQMAAASVKWDEENLAAIPADLPAEHNFSVKRYWHDRAKISRSWQAFCADPINHPSRKNLDPDGGEAVHTGQLRDEPKSSAPPMGGWKPIETAVPAVHHSILVKTDANPPVVGEAWWRRTDDDAELELWWANEGPGDYYSDPIRLGSGSPTHWMPMPTADGLPALPDQGKA